MKTERDKKKTLAFIKIKLILKMSSEEWARRKVGLE